MTRKKVKLSFISNDSARKATFKKRKKGLMKKVSELSTLCGIDACAIIYSPYESQPEVWPDTRACQRVVAQFKRMPEMEQSKKMVNQESFIRHRITKVADQLRKMHKDNREKEITQLMYQCLMGKGLHGLGVPELNDMGWLLDQKLKEIYKRIEGLEKEKKDGDAVVGSSSGSKPIHWVGEWMGIGTGENQSQAQDQCQAPFGGGGGGGDDMVMQFGAGEAINSGNHGGMWANMFFP